MIRQILVIDDEAVVRDAYKFALEDGEYEVRMAENGLQGLEMVKEKHPDLVFLDLKMPGMDGVETLRRLKAMDPRLNVYIVTAFQQEYFQSLKQAREEGLEFEVAIKPMNAEQIRMIARVGMH